MQRVFSDVFCDILKSTSQTRQIFFNKNLVDRMTLVAKSFSFRSERSLLKQEPLSKRLASFWPHNFESMMTGYIMNPFRHQAETSKTSNSHDLQFPRPYYDTRSSSRAPTCASISSQVAQRASSSNAPIQRKKASFVWWWSPVIILGWEQVIRIVVCYVPRLQPLVCVQLSLHGCWSS